MQLNVRIALDDYQALKTIVTREHIGLAEVVRNMVRREVAVRGTEPAQRASMERLAKARRRQIRRLAITCASAPDERLEKHARELWRLVEELPVSS